MTLPLHRQLGLRFPLIQAPMAGGVTTPPLVAAVSNAGALGSLGAGYLSARALEEAVGRVRDLSNQPFLVNLFVPPPAQPPSPAQVQRWLTRLAPYHAQLGLAPPALPKAVAEPLEDQLAAVLKLRPAVFSFAFGRLEPGQLAALQGQGIRVLGTATTLAEGLALEASGVDAVVAQGAEAGGHRGTFLGPFEAGLVPTLTLAAQLTAALRVPVIASGGLMDACDVTAALHAGAAMVQLGTAFLLCPEAGTSVPYRAALQSWEQAPQLLSAYSGRPARGLPNAFAQQVADLPPLPYPYQHALTRELRAAAARQGRPELLSLWAGTGFQRARALPAAELVQELMRAETIG
ncbi:NAD(P)H-dependent flavin oxidoreductase [Deinococcus sp.]|uniref:NAD(P)H-dependent flavin oxidoreductase n=1 Tax=Deinococcus sp. TaxID=47478 RepID=UPI003C7D677B